ncbi:Protein CBG25719 [Caenorhabditis briggsae]|uniref:Protein CBG25719 n=1 Tax=Caenorhabditis briggsae TaxID=6238 RepID=B6IGY2_CAEBR|nr:Protein CBG25719 [Caenorhabditis briggsae]CAR99162.1 Protein CBG25719 [Caenorhabditis briggsae]
MDDENDDSMETQLDGEDLGQSITDEGFLAQVQQRQQETSGMNQILQLVTDMDVQEPGTSSSRNVMEFSGIQQELNNIEKEHNEVLQKLEEASRSESVHQVPAALTNIFGTWRVLPNQEVHPSTTITPYAPAFMYKYMWYKLDGFNLHSVLFTGHNHQKSVETIGLETNGDIEGTRKMMYVDKDRLVTSHRRQSDGMEVMRVEVFVEDEKLYYIFQKDQYRYIRQYERAFQRT